ncbi:hypothetical protein [Georgenia alba]|uniref:ABC transporter permease n=1 Tax=Georgenia alba TaxID=2233858 RepID=A0ABW2QCV7_9MICO
MSTSNTYEAATSTAGTLRGARRVATTRPQWRRTLSWMLQMQLAMGRWFWLAVVLLWVAALVVVSLTPAGIELSMLQFAAHGALWFPFAMMITVAVAMITPHVAGGMTRRSFSIASLVSVGCVAAGNGLLLAVGLELEGVLYGALGWDHSHVANATDSAGVWEPWNEGFGVSWLSYTSRTAGGAVSGLLVGATYYRYGGLRGTFALPLTVAPAILGQDYLAGVVGDAFDVSLLGLSLAALALPVLAGVAFHRMIRTVPVR